MGSKNIYITKYYIQYSLIVLSGLSIFFVVIDYMQVGKELPSSANLQILYFYYKILHASSTLFPVSLVFGAVLTFARLVKDNSVIALYSVGYSDKDILTPVFITSIFGILIYISLFTTSFAYSKSKAYEIIKGNSFNRNSTNLFFKYDLEENNGHVKSYYIFFSKLYPIKKSAEGIRLFSLDEDGKLSEVIRAKYAYYDNSHWVIDSARFIKNSKNIEFNRKAFEIIDKDKFFVLNGFKPKILDKIYESEMAFNLIDLLEAMELMHSQGFNIEKLKVSLYNIVIYPFFAPLLIVLLFKMMPISSRFSNINLFVFTGIVTSLLFWGILFALIKLSFTGNLTVEFATTFPILILAFFSLYLI